MTFFQDFSIPEPPPRPRMPRFTPPPWTAPPRHELPVIVPVGRFVHKSQAFVMAIDAVRVHSAGCVIDLLPCPLKSWRKLTTLPSRHPVPARL